MQISGDLGKAGHLRELVDLVTPRFDAPVHGLWVGNNLIKANLDLGRLDEARRIVEQLYALQRPDWRQHLEFWTAEIAKAALPRAPAQAPAIQMLSIEGPVWTRDSSPFIALCPKKAPDAPRIAFFGSTALLPNAPAGPLVTLSDGPGRMSRALPLLLAEQAHLGTAAHAVALIPVVQERGFALFGGPYADADVCQMARAAAQVCALVVDARQEPWTVSFRLLRTADATLVGSGEEKVDPRTPWPGVQALAARLVKASPPQWYEPPEADYLLRLEQNLAVLAAKFAPGFQLVGEHEILDGTLQLCARHPANALVRTLFAQTLREMKKVRPGLVEEYRVRVEQLQREHACGGELLEQVLAEVFAR
jgi:hypothetical protein